MFCSKCGKQVKADAKFCEYCGAVINTPTISNEKSEQSGVTSKKISVKKEINKPLIITIIIAIVVLIAGSAGIILFDNYNHEKGDEEIQAVQDSYFEFLPEMKVGDLIYEYYGEDYWACNSDGIVEFWGTNKKDNSGLALHFSFVGKGIVDVPYIKFHEENEIAHDISKEAFEAYILSLYAQLDDSYQNSNITTQPVTEQTTTIKAITTAATTTTTKKQEKIKLSEKYMAYLYAIKEMNNIVREEGIDIDDIMYYNYYLYDINHDGTYELILQWGEYEADTEIIISTIDESSENGVAGLCEMPGGHIMLVEKDGKLYTNYCHASYQVIEEIKMNGLNSASHEVVFEGEVSGDYNDYGTAIKCYRMSDLSGIEALCPKELLEDKPYVNANIEASRLTRGDGYEYNLYVDGDFSYVEVSYCTNEAGGGNNGYTSGSSSPIFLTSGSSFTSVTAYVTLYSANGVAGETVSCTGYASGTIQSGGTSYPVDNMKGQINCHGGTVAGFTTDYVVNGGIVGKVRNSLGDTWHVTAKNACDNYGVTWYELWDSDDGDYYGWVDSSYIDFY